MEFITTKRGGQKVVREQYVYAFNSIRKSQPVGKYWKCEQIGCSARLITTGANNEFHSASGVHTHPPNPLSIVERNVRNEIKRKFGSNSLHTAKRTYQAIMQQHHTALAAKDSTGKDVSRAAAAKEVQDAAGTDQKEMKSDGLETKNETQSNESLSQTDNQQSHPKRFVFPKIRLIEKKKPRKDSMINEAYSILKSLGTHQKDDCATYGVYVGNKLGKLDDNTRAIAQHKINNVLFEAEMGMYRNLHPQPPTLERAGSTYDLLRSSPS